jgi:hypothetical protein
VSLLGQVAQEDLSKRPAIVSPSHPKDSLGETVYEWQGDDQKNIAVAPGILLPYAVLKRPDDIHIIKKLSKDEREDIEVTGVVDSAGDFIDAEMPNNAPDAIREAFLSTISTGKFRPATLDGKPVAALAKIVIRIKYHRFAFRW